MVTVGPFPSQLLWNVDAAQPSVLGCQHLTNLLRPVVWSTGSKYEFNLLLYLLPWLSRMLDEQRAPKDKGGAHRWESSHTLSAVQCTEIFNPCVIESRFILSLIFRYSRSKIETYIHRRIDELYTLLFMQPYRTTKQGKLSLRVKTSTLSSTFCDRLKNNLKSRVRDKENTSDLWQCDYKNRGHSDKILTQILK